MSERGPFCRQHGFHGECPQCAGTEIVWEIPVVDYGREVGTIRVSPEGEADVVGVVSLPWEAVPTSPPQVREGTLVRVPSQPVVAPAPSEPGRTPRRQRDHVSIRTNPGLLARVRNALGHQGLQDQGDQSLPDSTK